MKFKKIIFLLLLPYIITFVVSCCKCEETVFKNYTNRSFSLENIDNSGKEVKTSASSLINKRAFGIRVNLRLENIAQILKPSAFSFNTLNATSCECPPFFEFSPKDSIISFKLFTVNDLDNLHLANSEVTQYFKIFYNNSYTSVADRYPNKTFKGLTLYDESEFDAKIDLLLMTIPEESKKVQFKVQLKMSDGRILEQFSPETTLN